MKIDRPCRDQAGLMATVLTIGFAIREGLRLNGHNPKSNMVVTPLGLEPQSTG